MENRELKRALREQMACLEPLDRHLLALYYGADLSQEEVGRVLDVPQTTVSLKLREALGKLRAGLTTAGFAAAAPLLETGKLGDALLDGSQAPPGLQGNVMHGLASAARHSVATAAAGKSATGLLAILTLCVITAAVGWWGYTHWMQAAPPRANMPAPPADLNPEVPPEATPEPAFKPRVLLDLDFNDETSWRPHVVEGAGCRWLKDGGVGGSGCIVSDERDNTVVLDVGESASPLRITLQEKVMPLKQGEYYRGPITCLWRDYDTCAVLYNFSDAASAQTVVPGGFREVTIFLADKYSSVREEDGGEGFIWMKRRPTTLICLLLKGSRYFDNLKVEAVEPKQVPIFESYLRAIDAVPPEQRDGRLVPLSQLPASPKSETPKVRFYHR